ncbi:MAG: hypothetical protein HEQ20_10310 [Aphanizomenon flos-aquae KM1D3_PB]|uniref:hypothetical protein n=1 Tax=Aphanizomenon flos-aquae TaxID=1176 RepID=UPI00068C445A|nr:hypothetical protein [Aphanizomenon flos-aquae]QSV71071.1 MAG: hypothetical protein HEQ20_10310 [Aphanizomenon flos-aquae KM1D3_PB]
MLNIRNLVFALSLSPLIFTAWQLPSQAGGNPNAADSGGNPGSSTNTVFSAPPATTNTTVPVSAATVESTSSSVTVTDGATANTLVISLAPQVQVAVNQLATAIVQALSPTGGGTTGGGTTGGGTTGGGTTDGGTTGGGTTGSGTTGGGAADIGSLLTGGAGLQQAAVALTNSFIAAGIPPQKATALVSSLTGLLGSTNASLPNQPLAQATSGQLVASTKAFKPVYVIAQSGAGVSVNINKLNDAIVAYNGIILNSEPKTLKNLYRDTGFVRIGGILKQLRTAIK